MNYSMCLRVLTMIGTITLCSFAIKPEKDCKCNPVALEKMLLEGDSILSNGIPDSNVAKSFYSLPPEENKRLWYKEIETVTETKFTKWWNDYAPNNYHASHLGFVENYQGKENVELAFQFGPNGDLWAYHTFVIQKLGDCFLATTTYFRHARFISKKYAIISKVQMDTLYKILSNQPQKVIDTIESLDYSGYFVNNRLQKKYYINFKKNMVWVPLEIDSLLEPEKAGLEFKIEKHNPKTEELYNFVDYGIKWIRSYSL